MIIENEQNLLRVLQRRQVNRERKYLMLMWILSIKVVQSIRRIREKDTTNKKGKETFHSWTYKRWLYVRSSD